MANTDKVVCDRCGQKVFRRSLRIENFYRYDTSSKAAYVKSLMELENVTEEVALSWAEHGLFEQCEEKIRNCPDCGHPLATWRAKLCLKCGARFEAWK